MNLKFQSAFARRIRQSFHFSVINETAAIEDDFLDFLCKQTLRDRFADLLRDARFAAAFFAAKSFFRRRSRRQRLAGIVIDDLRINMLARKNGRRDADVPPFR